MYVVSTGITGASNARVTMLLLLPCFSSDSLSLKSCISNLPCNFLSICYQTSCEEMCSTSVRTRGDPLGSTH